MAASRIRPTHFSTALSGRRLIHRLIWIEALCFGLLIAFISFDDEILIPLVVTSNSRFSPHLVAGLLDSLGVVLLFLLALKIQLKVLDKIKLLEGMMSICASCKRIQDDKDHWSPIEEYIQKRSHADFSHTICPDCGIRLYGDLYLKANGKAGVPDPEAPGRHA